MLLSPLSRRLPNLSVVSSAFSIMARLRRAYTQHLLAYDLNFNVSSRLLISYQAQNLQQDDDNSNAKIEIDVVVNTSLASGSGDVDQIGCSYQQYMVEKPVYKVPVLRSREVERSDGYVGCVFNVGVHMKLDLDGTDKEEKQTNPQTTARIIQTGHNTEIERANFRQRVLDDAFSSMIKSNFPFLESLALMINWCSVEIFDIRCLTLRTLRLHFDLDNQIKKIELSLRLNDSINEEFFLTMREALELSSKFSVTVFSSCGVLLPFDIDDVRTILSFPATSVEELTYFIKRERYPRAISSRQANSQGKPRAIDTVAGAIGSHVVATG
uniref:Uncharacterized protein n=1 Tax=Tanacetum cinerariifolium TaxID=118510 RepID=A0A6L2ME93_TANCI|nr:hypothetical protein [Tanacetum cinerariifolium]